MTWESKLALLICLNNDLIIGANKLKVTASDENGDKIDFM